MPSRVKEGDLIVPALRLLSEAPDGFMSTSDLIAALEQYFAPEGADAEILAGRHDTHFSQKVRNLVSHRGASTGMEARGLAVYSDANEGWSITQAGRDFLGTADASS